MPSLTAAQNVGLPRRLAGGRVDRAQVRDLLARVGLGDRSGHLPAQLSGGQQQRVAIARAVGGTVLDPEVVAALVSGARQSSPMARLTPRETEVLTLMAEGRSNAAIAARLFVSEKAVGKHTNSIVTKLDLPQASDDNRRVLAVLAFLNASA
jgi:DNA-binding NarL/FixJ family response regulator